MHTLNPVSAHDEDLAFLVNALQSVRNTQCHRLLPAQSTAVAATLSLSHVVDAAHRRIQRREDRLTAEFARQGRAGRFLPRCRWIVNGQH